jgi:hypothetical protein
MLTNYILYTEKYKIKSSLTNSNYYKLLQDVLNKNNLNNYKIYKNFQEIINLEISLENGNIFICNPNNMIYIYFNNHKYNIPSDMTISEFKLFLNIQNNIFNINNMEMFNDEYFTTRQNYFSK